MPAPQSAYYIPTFNCFMNSLVQHQRAITTDTTAILKSRFYLDDLLQTTDVNGNLGFTGICYPNTFNYNMHNINRFGNARHKDGVVFNDAGLNTLGITKVDSILTTYPNRIRLISTSTSSYFDGSTRGYQISVNGGAWLDGGWTYPSFNSKETVTSQDLIGAGAKYNDQIRVRSYIVNPEGTYYSDPEIFYASDVLFSTNMINTNSACANSGNEIEIFMFQEDFYKLENLPVGESVTSGIYAWKDEAFTIPINDGWYRPTGDLINYYSYYVVGGEFTLRNFCNTPPASNSMYVYMGGGDPYGACHWGDDFTLVWTYLYYQGDLIVGQTVMYRDAYYSNVANQGFYSDMGSYLSIGANGIVQEFGSCF